ncbi:MAG: AEC family transporter [Betaproteobacteria bacterium]|nr:AEC family transporter [Betaproteobacteria bacterium]
MFLTILNIILPVIFVVLIGYLWNRYNKDFNPIAVTKLVANIGLPCLIYDSLTRSNLTINIYFKIFLSAVLVLAIGFLFGYLLIKIFRLPSIKLTTPLMHPNTGNMGIPLSLLAFGNEGLALAAGFASIVMVSHFTANTAISSGNYSLKRIILSPVLLSLIFSLIILFYKIEMPNFFNSITKILSGFVIPLVLLSLGISLSKINIKKLKIGFILGLFKLISGPFIGLLVVYLLKLDGNVAKVVILQASMPAAILTYLIAAQNNSYDQEIGTAVFVSTIGSAFSIPIILFFLL